jgi:hypothetical protein
MAGLGVHQGKVVELIRLNLVKRSEGDLQKFDHGLILRPGNGPDGRYGTGSYPPPQEPLQGQGAGNGVGVGIDENEQAVFMIK